LHNAGANYGYAYSYASNIWGTYVGTYGKNDTVGFSFAGVNAASQVNDALNMFDYLNPYGRPYLYAVHLYGDAQNVFNAFHTAFVNRGETSAGWIVGETFYNDYTNAQAIRTASNSTGRLVHYVLQWPLNRNSSAQDVDQAPVNSFDNYITWGF
jgi:hypothetical protein